MQARIILRGGVPGKSQFAPWVFETDAGKYRVWPFVNDDPNPNLEILRHGIGNVYDVEYTEEQWSPPDKPNTKIPMRYITSLKQAEGAAPSNMQNAGNAAQGAVAAAGAQHTQGSVSAHTGAYMDDLAALLERDFHVSAFWGQANALLHSGQVASVLQALSHTEADVRRFFAGDREYNEKFAGEKRTYATDNDEYVQTHEREIQDWKRRGSEQLVQSDGPPDDLPPVEAYEQ